jgi:cytochrome c oxidase subunit III
MNSPELSHQFEDLQQQQETAHLGMWTFLATEVLFFGGLFCLYTIYRYAYPHAFEECSRMMNLWLGALNTFVLLTSSLTMAMAVNAAEEGRSRAIIRWLCVTGFLGSIFLVVKAFEYHHKFTEHLIPGIHFGPEFGTPRGAEIFFSLYFIMTGLHAVHMIIGLGLLTTIGIMAARGRFTATYHNPVQVTGLYWHFVDIVWIFLYPLLYLVGAR